MLTAIHTLLGRKVVHLENSATQIVRRVRYTAEGEPYVRYFGSHLVFITRADCSWVVTPINFRRQNMLQAAEVPA